MLKAIVIDDLIHSVTLLKHYLQEMGGVEVIASYTEATDAMAELPALQPDIVFLDIEMPDSNGIDIAREIWRLADRCEIVFVTAYDHYALDAFGVHAIDYILKPVDPDRLRAAVDNIKKRRFEPPAAAAPQPALKARLMGDFVLYGVSGEPVKWRTRKTKELCAYLLHHGKPIHRAQIVEDLWPDASMEKANNSLHMSLYQLRRGLEHQGCPNAVSYADERYSLRIAIASDVEVIEQWTGSLTAEDISALMQLHQAEYLEGEDYPWALKRRERMRKRLVQTLEEAADVFGSKQPVQKYAFEQCLEKLIELDPYNERYVKRLLRFYCEQEEENKARERYESYKRMLWTELKEEPGFAFEELAPGRP